MAECARAFPPYHRQPDGGQHAMQGDQDDARSIEIAAHGYRVIRFWNGEVMENLAGVLEMIRRELTIPPAPGGGERAGVRWEISRHRSTLPIADATGPLPLRSRAERALSDDLLLTISLSAPGGGEGSLAKWRAVGMCADLGPQVGIERADAAAVVFVHGRIVALDGLRRGRLGRADLSKGGIATLEQHLVAGNRGSAVDIDPRLLGGELGIQIGELPVGGGERLGLRILF